MERQLIFGIGLFLIIINLILCARLLSSMQNIKSLTKKLNALKSLSKKTNVNKPKGLEMFKSFHQEESTNESLELLNVANQAYSVYIARFRIYLGSLFICLVFVLAIGQK